MIDLDELIVQRSLEPIQVRVFGRTWTVRRDYSAADVMAYWRTSDTDQTTALAMIVGDQDAADLNEAINALPTEMATQPLRRLLQIAGLLQRREGDDQEDEPAGDHSAP